MKRGAAALAVLIVLSIAPGAQAAVSFNDIEDEVMCVSCNVSLNIAESRQADQEREEIRQLIRRGLTKQQIKDTLVSTYGKNVLAEPQAEGFSLVAWLIPIGAALGLIALGMILLPRWRAARRDDDGASQSSPELDAADAARLEADMAQSPL